jgi:hypothetical protein
MGVIFLHPELDPNEASWPDNLIDGTQRSNSPQDHVWRKRRKKRNKQARKSRRKNRK